MTNRALVWVVFMLLAGGLSYKAIARRLGVTVGKLRTFRTLCGVPVDYDRKKAGDVFDLELALITWKNSQYVLVREAVSEDVSRDRTKWFWVPRRDVGRLRLPPGKRRGERIPGMPRSNTFTIITREILANQPRLADLLFAPECARILAR